MLKGSGAQDARDAVERAKGMGGVVFYAKAYSPVAMDVLAKTSPLCLVSRFGSQLSHPAVLAREAGVPFLSGKGLPEWAVEGVRVIVTKDGEMLA